MPFSKKAAIGKECVACGCCVKVCPKKAIAVHKGLWAVVNSEACIGCGKCAGSCPAGVIEIMEVEALEEAVV